MGYIRGLNDKWKLGFEVGHGSNGIFSSGVGEDYKLTEYRADAYFLTRKKKSQQYLSVEAFFINQTQTLMKDDLITESGVRRGYRQADYLRRKYGMLLEFGILQKIDENIGINFFYGGGFRIRNNKFENLIYRGSPFHRKDFFPPFYRNEGIDIFLEINIGLKIFFTTN